MALRRRLSIIAAASVGVAIFIAVAACYAVVRSQLLGQVTDSLYAQKTAIEKHEISLGQQLPVISASAGGPAQYQQVVLGDGQTTRLSGNLPLPVDSEAQRIAATGNGTEVRDVTVGTSHLRLLTFGAPRIQLQPGAPPVNGAVQLARPLNGVDTVLRDLRLILFLVLAAGVVVAGLLGRMASRRVLKPLNEVAATAAYIGETDDLSQRLKVHADDEVGQLATRFNAMLDRLQRSRAALDDSVRAQRQLVADASHELRTPVTSLRTNIEILLETPDLEPLERREMLRDVVEQSEELSTLVNDLIELARGDEPGADAEDVRLDRIVAGCLERAHRNAPTLRFIADLHPARLDGVAERLERAVNNLLDNAARHSPPRGTVEVHAGPDGVTVRDHGSGVAEEDLPYLFDRFYRGTNSRGSQGSGLGLAIVRQVTEQHGGQASVANAPDGGAVFSLALPASPPDDTGEHAAAPGAVDSLNV
ncbi:MAG TPA: HAMP domain-containing sensor histidine kinase [Solirubrobacteraceae bacterium]|nr:HAMP domain-containing sensor histidine kinase [Solirubrobacteraceae bacterium]